MNRTEMATKHEREGGYRTAYIHGWETFLAGSGLFRAMKEYEGQAQTSFIAGYHEADKVSVSS